MKDRVFIAFALLLLGLLAPQLARTQGTIYVSTLDQVSDGTVPVAGDSWVAAWFQTGDNPGGYKLDSIQLLMGAATGAPSDFSIVLYRPFVPLSPGNVLGVLSGPEPVSGSRCLFR